MFHQNKKSPQCSDAISIESLPNEVLTQIAIYLYFQKKNRSGKLEYLSNFLLVNRRFHQVVYAMPIDIENSTHINPLYQPTASMRIYEEMTQRNDRIFRLNKDIEFLENPFIQGLFGCTEEKKDFLYERGTLACIGGGAVLTVGPTLMLCTATLSSGGSLLCFLPFIGLGICATPKLLCCSYSFFQQKYKDKVKETRNKLDNESSQSTDYSRKNK